jgi:hypothetical protein
LSGTHGPAALQHDVVDLLKGNSGVFTNEIDRIEEVLGAVEAKLPWFFLLEDNRLERSRGGSVAAS